jgi:hypothetical protein
VGISKEICEIILFFINDFPEERSIIHAYPDTLVPRLSITFAHSKLDFPVVITSSTINIF